MLHNEHVDTHCNSSRRECAPSTEKIPKWTDWARDARAGRGGGSHTIVTKAIVENIVRFVLRLLFDSP